MRIAILGAGAMGSLIGYFLQRGGAEISLVDPYEDHMNAIKDHGLELTINGEMQTAKMQTFTAPEKVGVVDAVIVLVKCPVTEQAISSAKSLFGDKTYAITLQNGVGNDDVLKNFFPAELILKGVMKITCQLTAPGKISSNILGDLTAVQLGTVTGDAAASATATRIVDILCKGGLTAEYQEKIDDYIWGKAINNIAVNSSCAIVRCNIRSYCTHPEGRLLLERCLREVIKVAAAKNIILDFDKVIDSIEKHTIPKFGSHLPSTAQDVKAKQKTEIDFLNGAISRYGKELGIDTPVNDVIAAFIRIIQDNYENQF